MSTVERCLVACFDDEQVLAHGARLVGDAAAAALEKLARERDTFCGELALAGRTLHHSPRARASWTGSLRRALFDARRFTTGPNAGDVIFACRRSQIRLEAVFARALENSWSREITDVLTVQHCAIANARAVLVGLQYGA